MFLLWSGRVKSHVSPEAEIGCNNWVMEDRSGASPAVRLLTTLGLRGVGTESGIQIVNADEVLQVIRSLCTSLEKEM